MLFVLYKYYAMIRDFNYNVLMSWSIFLYSRIQLDHNNKICSYCAGNLKSKNLGRRNINNNKPLTEARTGLLIVTIPHELKFNIHSWPCKAKISSWNKKNEHFNIHILICNFTRLRVYLLFDLFILNFAQQVHNQWVRLLIL